MGVTTAAPGLHVPDEHEIRLELALVLSSTVFRGSKRCHDFTNYVCGKVLEGAGETLKERTIAIDVFGRRPNELFGEDNNIVRVGAREVRRRLALYYGAEGANDAVRIELPIGAYVPVFRYQTERAPVISEPLSLEAKPDDEAASPLKVQPANNRRRWFVVAAVAAIGLLALGLKPTGQSPTGFSTFWGPAFDSAGPTLMVMPHPIVYHPSSRALLLDEQLNGKPNLAMARPIHVPAQRLDGADFVPILNQYVGFGDAVAAHYVSSIFEQRGGSVQLRLADKLEFSDLYGSTVVLVGGSFSNRWTAEMTKNLRYRFLFQDQSRPWIVDSQSDRKWGLSSMTEDRRTPEDYILICRMPHAQTGQFMVVVAGLAVYGTEAGGRILSDPKLLEPVLQSLPKDWENHNLEMVMKLEVVSEGPGLPSLVAAHTW